ncbi:hypothetical protein FVEN_g2766 [Fusarium venenatum]|uniref:Zn(2)-C6 fungal-type domain-containing protein n=1 Tax=Fusarium venenatum TaxID=56646 RepID=A0A2L2TMJ3_9HYPO|nr:uncharacterized protein FVRRES_06136 [Fusarium venenatum]KAG8359461.1 hypothetical protein FVEN_g2766 [Fusarium venenatum]KAH6993158.1 fungal-specific transcription factor domain-containing protein [Fusarium venenatum]CEI61700.1 unnamed protein product [Fusarium venenatum]
MPRVSAPKISKACMPCRARKIKCDAPSIGLPCSSCVSRETTGDCVLSIRKRRTLRGRNTESRRALSNDNDLIPTPVSQNRLSHADSSATNDLNPTSIDGSIHASQGCSSHAHDSPDSPESHVPRRPQPDLLYLNILQDTVDRTAASQNDAGNVTTNDEDNCFNTQIRNWNPLLQLDEVDNEYLSKKGVFKLPAPKHMDAFVKAYFDHVYPFAPVLNRAEFMESYRSGDCSLFLLHAISTAGSPYVPLEVIKACGYTDRSAAHMAFFLKAKLFHDFHCQGGSLPMLQGSMILGAIIPDHPSDRDFHYWFHNSVRWASRLGLHSPKPRPQNEVCQKLYRRIWWVLHNRDIFYFFVNTQNLRLLVTAPPIEPLTEDDWEDENILPFSDLLSPINHQQRVSLVAHTELAQIFGDLTTTITGEPSQDMQRVMQPLDRWRISLPIKMNLNDSSLNDDPYLLEALTTSYRFECVMCRSLRRGRWGLCTDDARKWAQGRFRAATLELDSILKKVLLGDIIRMMPTTFITTIAALLALHIESALDSSQSDIARSMARVSIQFTMLALNQIQDAPAIKRALPAFEMVLSKNKLYPSSLHDVAQVETHGLQEGNIEDESVHVAIQSDTIFSQDVNDQIPFLGGDLAGFEFFDRWQMEQLDFTGILR